MSFVRNLRVVALASTTSLLAISVPAFAQDAAAEGASSGVKEIIVTAQKKSQNLQDVSISIAAFDTAALESGRIEGVSDLGALTPGLYVTPSPADPNGVRLNIRGIGTFDPQVGQDSRVAIYMDGVYVGKSQGLAFDSPDLARIEVVKGPQGTLYGRNAVAGAINLISERPSGEFTGKLKADYGRFNEIGLKGAVNIPFNEDGGIRISGLYSDKDGWVKNSGPGVDFGGGKKYAFRVALGADVTPDLRLDMAFDYNRSKAEPLYYQSIPGFSAATSPFKAAVTSRVGRQNTAKTSFVNEAGDLKTLGFMTSAEWKFAENHQLKFIGSYRETDSQSFTTLVPDANPVILNAIVNAPAGVGLPSINGAFLGAIANLQTLGVPARAGLAGIFTPLATPGPQTGLFLSPPGGAIGLKDHQQYSGELTFNGEFADGSLEYTTGVFYFNEKTGSDANPFVTRNPNDYANRVLTLGALPTAFGVALTPINLLTPTSGSVVGFRNSLASGRASTPPLRIQTEAIAVYSEVTWHATDQLRVTGGLRYSHEKKNGQQQGLSPFYYDTFNLLGQPILPNIGQIKFGVLNPSFVVEFDANDDVMLYASFKQSFRSGGFNQSATSPRTAGLTYGPDFIFNKETLNSYEAGVKAQLFDNRLRFNAAGFYYDFQDVQVTAATNALVAIERAVVNTNDKIWGAEFDALLAVTDSLSLNATYSWINGNAGDVPNLISGGVDVRKELQGTPKNSFVIGASYNSDLSDSVGLFANVNYSHKDSVLNIPANALRLTNQDLVSGQIGLNLTSSNGTKFTVSAWGQNIFDDEYTIDSLPFETFAERTVIYGQPASYGVSVSVDF